MIKHFDDEVEAALCDRNKWYQLVFLIRLHSSNLLSITSYCTQLFIVYLFIVLSQTDHIKRLILYKCKKINTYVWCIQLVTIQGCVAIEGFLAIFWDIAAFQWERGYAKTKQKQFYVIHKCILLGEKSGLVVGAEDLMDVSNASYYIANEKKKNKGS